MSPQVLGPGVVNLIGVADGVEVYLAVLNFVGTDPQIDLSGSTLTRGSVSAVLESLVLLSASEFGQGRSVAMDGARTVRESELQQEDLERVAELRLRGATVRLRQ